MSGNRNDQGTGQGIVEKDCFSEYVWRALILSSTVAVLLFSIYCLSHGITIIFMHLYYFPIVLLAYRYRYRGFVLATLLSLAYVGLVVIYYPEQAEVTGALCRFAVFVGITAVVAYLSERLVAVQLSQNERLETIRNLQQFQESVITNANVWITVLAQDGTILVWNDAAETICGYKRGDVLGKRTIWRDLYPEKAYRQKVTREIQRIIQLDTYLENFETEIRCADGTQKTIVWNTRGIRDAAGTPQSYIAIGQDITKHKQADEALRESKEFLNKIINSISDPIHVKDRQHRVILINDAACRLFNLSREEIIGKTAYELFPGKEMADISWQKDEEVFRTGEERVNEETNTYAFGKTFTVLVKKTLYTDIAGNQFLVGITTDITDRKRAEEQRETLIHELEQKNAELDRFAYTVSHDLKNPLITVRGFLGLLEEDIRNKDPVQAQADITRITSAAEIMEHLITTLLELSRSGRTVDAPVRIPFTNLVREAAGLLETSLRKRGVTLVIPDNLPEVSGDRQRLLQVMINLLDNAVKFMGNQQEPRVEVGVRSDAGTPVFFVQDNGMGIRKENQSKAFALFERFNPDVPGSGIGLSTVKRIIEAHGGKIWAESEGIGKGTTIYFTLPGPAGDGDEGGPQPCEVNSR